ncbi:MAG: antibiotic biosynthesis monooxygenase [Chloroflexi bacterium]|nr:antibiotic biosynthesis monooxygenase [Chloroflexota bacterium]
MVITVLEAQVAPEKAAVLEAAYKQAIKSLDAGIAQTFLLRSSKEPALWQIVTVWESREALEAMRQSGETPRGVLIFQTVGAQPALSVFGVAAHARSSA